MYTYFQELYSMRPNALVEFLGCSMSEPETIAEQLKGCHRWDAYGVEERVLLHVQDYPEQFPYLVLLERHKWNEILKCFREPE
jgi:hypothetical protein